MFSNEGTRKLAHSVRLYRQHSHQCSLGIVNNIFLYCLQQYLIFVLYILLTELLKLIEVQQCKKLVLVD